MLLLILMIYCIVISFITSILLIYLIIKDKSTKKYLEEINVELALLRKK